MLKPKHKEVVQITYIKTFPKVLNIPILMFRERKVVTPTLAVFIDCPDYLSKNNKRIKTPNGFFCIPKKWEPLKKEYILFTDKAINKYMKEIIPFEKVSKIARILEQPPKCYRTLPKRTPQTVSSANIEIERYYNKYGKVGQLVFKSFYTSQMAGIRSYREDLKYSTRFMYKVLRDHLTLDDLLEKYQGYKGGRIINILFKNCFDFYEMYLNSISTAKIIEISAKIHEKLLEFRDKKQSKCTKY